MTRRRRGGGVDVCSLLRAFAAKKTSRSCMGLSDVSSYCCGVALRYAAYRSAAIKYDTHLVPLSAAVQYSLFHARWSKSAVKTSMCFTKLSPSVA